MQTQNLQIIDQIKFGAIGILPTDTIYGVVARALDSSAVERVYEAKGREKQKKMIVLIGDYEQLPLLGMQISDAQKEILDSYWPGPYSVELETSEKHLEYLHANTGWLAVRMPDRQWLRELVKNTGPIIATSANKSGFPTPSTLHEIQAQLPDLDFYVEGEVGSTPSQLLRIYKDGKIENISR